MFDNSNTSANTACDTAEHLGLVLLVLKGGLIDYLLGHFTVLRVRRLGSELEVRGHTKAESYRQHVHEFGSYNLTLLPFPSPQYGVIISISEE